MTFAFVLIFLAAFVGLCLALRGPVGNSGPRKQPKPRPGWIAFVSTSTTADEPVGIARTDADPREGGLNGLQSLSPQRLHVLHCFECQDSDQVELVLRANLAEYRIQGNWYDRDAALMLLAHIKGEV
jgi:hypothetical protein